jgi:DnaJ domain
MTAAFTYRPKFVDVRVKKPAPETAAPKPGERACDHVGCDRPGRHPAPKARDRSGEYWFFCIDHAGEYNRRWNYFEGMGTGEFDEFAKAAEYGHRPTWSFGAGRNDREASVRRAMAGGRGTGFGAFRNAEGRAKPRKHLSRLESMAIGALGLEPEAEPAAIRAKYAELIKRYHPDSNGGDRSCEALLEKTVRAYQVLKAGGHV